jgi:uncharacterized protein
MKKKILIAGGSGFLGQQLTSAWEKLGYDVSILSRSHSDARYKWDPDKEVMNPAAFDGVSVLVNLAGENVGDGRWTDSRKKRLKDSRIKSIRTLVIGLKASGVRPYILGASGIAWYGNLSADQEVTELSEPGYGFLPELTHEWEAAYSDLRSLADGLAIMRIGVVLHKQFGAYPKMVKPLRFGVGAIPGSGRQMISWIHSDDLVTAVLLLSEKRAQGIFNFTAPLPVSMRDFMLLASAEINRPLWPFRIPSWFLKVLLGQQAELVLEGAAVLPEKLLNLGFTYRYPDLLSALKSLEKKDSVGKNIE